MVIIVSLAGIVWFYYPQLMIANGYAAKKICTCTLANGRNQDLAEKQLLYFSVLSFVKNEVDTVKLEVRSSFWGLSPRVAQYRPGIGCVLLHENDDYHVKFPTLSHSNSSDTLFWPYGTKDLITSTKGINKNALQKAVSDAFDQGGDLSSKRTTAVLVIHNDTLVAEEYAKTYGKETPQLGWSMTKSLVNSFVGLLVQEGMLDIEKRDLFKEWNGSDLNNITLNDLLHMNSGLDWVEDYAKVSDATRMLYDSEDISKIALTKTLKYPIGSHWYYSSGTSNLISKYLRNHINDDTKYHKYLKINLFHPLNMSSAFIETDESGNFIGSSYGYATPRDWAKYGLLYLHDGIWNGKRLLPEGWTSYTQKEARGSEGRYGAHFWLNKNGIEYPDAPYDLYSANGFQGQYVFIIPSRNVVIVRMGTGDDGFDANLFLKNILSALPITNSNLNQ